MKTGKVKFFNETKAFGFIVDAESGQEVFVHKSGLKSSTIAEGDDVTYSTKQGKKGINAIDVVKV